jgi:hypothetical protein
MNNQRITDNSEQITVNGKQATAICALEMDMDVRFNQFRVQARMGLQARAGGEPREYRAQLVRAGRVTLPGGRPGNLVIAPQALADAAGRNLFTGLPMFVDHAAPAEHPSLRDMAGVVQAAVWAARPELVLATFRLYATPAGELIHDLLQQLLADQETETPVPDVGISLVFWVGEQEKEGPQVTVTRIHKLESADFVFEPAADGRVLEMLSAYTQGETTMPEEITTPAAGDPEPQSPAPIDSAEQWRTALAANGTRQLLAASGLPEVVRERLGRQTYATPDELQAAITAARDELATLHETNVINLGGQAPRENGVHMGLNGMDRLTLAAEALIAGTRPAQGVAPLTGIRELYLALSGDYEMTGRFFPERVQFANVDTSTMAGLVANVLNKTVINRFQEYPQWWAPIVSIEDFNTLQDTKWITLGGVGELPTVTEGAAYTEMTWDDQTETNAFVKKGGYLGITLEAIDKDDTRRLAAAPRALAQAAWLTLGKAVSNIFTTASGTGPTMSDSNVLFDAANHSNLLTTAFSYTAWKAVTVAMMKQTELNSGERLGFLTRPKYVYVPIDLYNTAVEVLASEYDPSEGSTTSYLQANIEAQGNGHDERVRNAKSRIIVDPFATDTNNWGAIADPMLYPSIGLGFRYGRTPEVFSVASPTAGLMFSNDTMPVKVRFFFAVGPTDWRGLHKNNVA